MAKEEKKAPKLRFNGYTNDWEQRKFGDLYKKVSEKNDGTYGADKIISVANMYYKSDVKISGKNYLKTYNIFKVGDIAFEGNKSKHFAHGRFVENTIGDGIVSLLIMKMLWGKFWLNQLMLRQWWQTLLAKIFLSKTL